MVTGANEGRNQGNRGEGRILVNRGRMNRRRICSGSTPGDVSARGVTSSEVSGRMNRVNEEFAREQRLVTYLLREQRHLRSHLGG